MAYTRSRRILVSFAAVWPAMTIWALCNRMTHMLPRLLGVVGPVCLCFARTRTQAVSSGRTGSSLRPMCWLYHSRCDFLVRKRVCKGHIGYFHTLLSVESEIVRRYCRP